RSSRPGKAVARLDQGRRIGGPDRPPSPRRSSSPAEPWRASNTVAGYHRGAMHAWHDVELGDDIARHFRAVIEIPKGSKAEYEHYHDIAELPAHRLRELERFFLDYKALENKIVNVEDFRGRREAEDVVRAAVRLYRERIAPTLGRVGAR